MAARASLAAVVLMIAADMALAGPGRDGEGQQGPGAAQFAPAVRAWKAKDAHGIAVLVPPEGRLSLSLEGAGAGRVTGQTTREQAEAILKGYFAKIEGVVLKDATPADVRSFTRVYDYTYRPRGGSERSTRLSFTLQRSADGTGFVLVAVEERVVRR